MEAPKTSDDWESYRRMRHDNPIAAVRKILSVGSLKG
jgi:hypothetical protein